jgi:tRNA-modifying protein YgfZ
MTKNTNTLCDLSNSGHLGLIEISGADAFSFLQGQVTNDVMHLAGSESIASAHFTAYCNPKGRMLALFLAFAQHNSQLGNYIHLQLNRELLEPIMKRLKMYVMRSKVDIQDVSNSLLTLGIDGPQAASMLVSLFNNIPTNDYQIITHDNTVILKLPTIEGHTRFQIFCDVNQAPAIFNTLKENCELVAKPHWDWLDIQMGIPDISLRTQEQFVPQMLNLDLLNGINFKKGCYTGQEIVARTHYLGSVKRRTYLAETSGNPQAGDKVTTQDNTEVGQIVRSAPNLIGGFDVLAELRIESSRQPLQCNAAILNLKIMPYSLD